MIKYNIHYDIKNQHDVKIVIHAFDNLPSYEQEKDQLLISYAKKIKLLEKSSHLMLERK